MHADFELLGKLRVAKDSGREGEECVRLTEPVRFNISYDIYELSLESPG